MTYKLHREVVDRKVTRLSLGVADVDSYLKFLQYRCRPNTWISYGYDLQIFLNFIRKPLLDVTSADILAFIDSQQSASNRQGRTKGVSSKGPGLSNRTINRRLAAVASLYEYLRVFHDLPGNKNPVPRSLAKRNVFWANRYGNTASLALIRVPQTLPRPLDPEEIDLFLNSLLTHRDKAMVLLMLLAGLRKSEVLKLGLKDIDFGQHTLMVREGKGGHQRVVAISDTGLRELMRYLNEERPPSRSDKVFLVMKGRNRGKPLTVRALDTIVEYHRKKANTPGVQCHRMRHTCFTRLRQGGMSLEALQAQAGHSSINTTRIYLHLCPKELQQEYLQMSDQLFSSSGASRRPTID
ncbi:MAG TPA: tyrosine-type recombinase/integrase [Dehalococcoidales bacterium]|nr:tyrosine-type recombinase/integrase [Dehalococcoidales bacterium]